MKWLIFDLLGAFFIIYDRNNLCLKQIHFQKCFLSYKILFFIIVKVFYVDLFCVWMTIKLKGNNNLI